MAGNVITVRFQESEFYDIQRDAECVRFMATTAQGSYWTDVPIEGPRALRHDRERFKEMAVDMIRAGATPCFIEMGETEQ